MEHITTVELHGASVANSGSRRKPPKLKSVDRSVSMVVDNYTPLTSAALSARHAGALVIDMDNPSSVRRSSPNVNEMLLKLHSQSHSSELGAVGGSNMDDYPPSALKKSSSFRRGDTIDSSNSTSLTYLRKTPSFHSSGSADDGVETSGPLLRHHSVRHHPTTPAYPSFQQSAKYLIQMQQQSAMMNIVESSVRNARRNCNMHRSFHDPQKQRPVVKRDAVKSNSFNNEDIRQQYMMLQQQQQLQQLDHQGRKHSSMEGDLYRSRSNSRNNQMFEEQLQIPYLNVRRPSPLPSPMMASQYNHATSPTANSPRQMNSNSMDELLASGGLSGSSSPRPTGANPKNHMLRHQHTIASLNPQYLSPIPLVAFDKSLEDIYQLKSPSFDNRKAYSLRYKNGPQGNTSKENRDLFRARKSKSFISDMDPSDMQFGMSPAVSPGLSASGSVKKHHSPLISPSPQARANMILDDMKRGSPEFNQANPNLDFGTIDFNTIYKSYRQQKNTSGNRRHKHRRKKNSITNNKLDDDMDPESNKKRKRIVCIVMSVFLSLVLFAIMAVVVTLTHFSAVQVQNQTRQVYTFARESPIHYPSIKGGKD